MEQLLQPVNDASLIPNLGSDNKMFRERLLELFQPTDWVQVINSDSVEFTWAYMPADKEQITFDGATSTVPMKNTYRPDPEVYRLNPGQRATLVGANAYIMIEGLAKQLIAKKTIDRSPDVKPGMARKFNWTDGIAQDEMIKRIYLGKNMPHLAAEVPDETVADVNKDLGLDDTEPAKASPGRSSKAAV